MLAPGPQSSVRVKSIGCSVTSINGDECDRSSVIQGLHFMGSGVDGCAIPQLTGIVKTPCPHVAMLIECQHMLQSPGNPDECGGGSIVRYGELGWNPGFRESFIAKLALIVAAP